MREEEQDDLKSTKLFEWMEGTAEWEGEGIALEVGKEEEEQWSQRRRRELDEESWKLRRIPRKI